MILGNFNYPVWIEKRKKNIRKSATRRSKIILNYSILRIKPSCVLFNYNEICSPPPTPSVGGFCPFIYKAAELTFH